MFETRTTARPIAAADDADRYVEETSEKTLQRLRLVISSVIALGTCISVSAWAQTQVIIGASKDNTLYQNSMGALSNGAGDHFFVGTTASLSENIRRGLLAFNIRGSIPTGATIISVTLTLHMSRTTSGPQIIQLRRVLSDWGEGTSKASGEEGAGGPSMNGDATWIHKFFNTNFWTTPGADFDSTGSASQSVSGVGFYTWGSTMQMVNDVQTWLDMPSSNFGWLLLGVEGVPPTAKRFDTRENISANFRPKLTLDYTMTVGTHDDARLPTEYALHQNYPNPFNPSTKISIDVPVRSDVSLVIYDVLGQTVRTLVREEQPAGAYRVSWDGMNNEGRGVPTGVYFLRLEAIPTEGSAANYVAVKKMVSVK